MIRHSTITYDEFLNYMKLVPEDKRKILEKENITKRKERVYAIINGVQVNLTSQRLILFEKNNKCVDCGLVGTYLALEKTNEIDKSYHLNLYGIRDGEEILMTKDHIFPKSLGGSNKLKNYQTMCCVCNMKKGDEYAER